MASPVAPDPDALPPVRGSGAPGASAGASGGGASGARAQQGPGEDGILRAAIAVMTEHGYHGTSVRDIAARAGISPAALYYHFASKQDVLATIMERGIEALLRVSRAALAAAGDEPAGRLGALVETHVLFHLRDQRGTMLAPASCARWRSRSAAGTSPSASGSSGCSTASSCRGWRPGSSRRRSRWRRPARSS